MRRFLACLVAAMLFSSASAQVEVRQLSDFEAGTRAYQRGNTRMAITFFEQGVAKGDPQSEFALATYYHFGEGVQRDFGKARALFESSASKDFRDAKTFLGLIYRQAEGVKEDKGRALSYFSEAAYQCSDQAQLYLAEMLFLGEGTPVAESKALAWLYLSEASGQNPKAKEAAAFLEGKLAPGAIASAKITKLQLESKLKCPQ